MIRPTEEEAEYNIIIAALTPQQVRAVTLFGSDTAKQKSLAVLGATGQQFHDFLTNYATNEYFRDH